MIYPHNFPFFLRKMYSYNNRPSTDTIPKVIFFLVGLVAYNNKQLLYSVDYLLWHIFADKCYRFIPIFEIFSFKLWIRLISFRFVKLFRLYFTACISSVGIGLQRTGEVRCRIFRNFTQRSRDWNLKPIFTQKWASIDMNLGSWTPTPSNSNPAHTS